MCHMPYEVWAGAAIVASQCTILIFSAISQSHKLAWLGHKSSAGK